MIVYLPRLCWAWAAMVPIGIQLSLFMVADCCLLGLSFLAGCFTSFGLGGFAEWRSSSPWWGQGASGACREHAPRAGQGQEPRGGRGDDQWQPALQPQAKSDSGTVQQSESYASRLHLLLRMLLGQPAQCSRLRSRRVHQLRGRRMWVLPENIGPCAQRVVSAQWPTVSSISRPTLPHGDSTPSLCRLTPSCGMSLPPTTPPAGDP